MVVKGELTAKTPSGNYVLKQNEGVLIPAGSHYGFTNAADEELIFLSLRTESSGGRYSSYDRNAPSNIQIKFPAEQISGRGLAPSRLSAYALDRTTFGISGPRDRDWDRNALLRMACQYEKSGDYVVATLPERLVRWYKMEGLLESDYNIIPEPDKTKVRIDLGPLIGKQGK